MQIPMLNLNHARSSFAQRKPGRAPKTEHSRVDQRQTALAFFDNKNQGATQILPGWDVAAFEQPFEIGVTAREFRGVISSGVTLDAKIELGYAARLTFGNTARLDVHHQIFLVLLQDVEPVRFPYHMIRRADDACDRDAQIAYGQLSVDCSRGPGCWERESRYWRGRGGQSCGLAVAYHTRYQCQPGALKKIQT